MKGSATPSTFVCFSAFPRVNPLLRKIQPQPIPAIKPTSPTSALRSPPPRRMTILRGQPRKTRAPTIMKKPRMNRSSGELPALLLNSPLMTLTANAPRTMPMISGRMYCTVAALCRLREPAMSRMKHAMQNPMFPGLPKCIKTIATAPMMTPVMARFLFSFNDFI